MAGASEHYEAVVIGSGFGGTMTALPLAREFKARGQGEKVLMLERGTWWTTPVGTVQDKEVAAFQFLESKQEPVQFWSSAEHFRGFLDIFTRCVRRASNPDGLYDLTNFGRYGLFRLGLAKNDGVTILRASGVGGGSLVYANVTIRPPEFVLTASDWPVGWDKPTRDFYYDLARDAIGVGVLWALNDRDAKANPASQPAVKAGPVNTGLSNIVTRTARLDPKWQLVPDPNNARGVKRIDASHSAPGATPPDIYNNLWIDRARVFQSTMGFPGADGSPALTSDFGTVDSSINDINPEPSPFDPKGQPKNYCERQGRCIVGCLPGARHTLNKQLMGAIVGAPPSKLAPQGQPPLLDGAIEIRSLAEVTVIRSAPGGGPPYEVQFSKRDPKNPGKSELQSVTADRVIVAAGCVGTNEILLRCQKEGTIPNLSPKVGYGFSTNGDYLAFLDNTRERVSLTRGPVTTSFAHFHTEGDSMARFHTIEDNGIPRALSSVAGYGTKLVKSLSKGRHTRVFIWFAILRYLLGRIPAFVISLFRNPDRRQQEFESEDELTMNMMCIAAMGRAAADGQFRLGGAWETPLRVERPAGKQFVDDPIYTEISNTLRQFAGRLSDEPGNDFENPFVTRVADAFNAKSIGLSHPLGGCRMARTAADGVCDEFGRVFDTSKDGGAGVHEGLYVTDAARIPTSLGVNPSLTITALALYSVKHIIEGLPPAQTSAQPAHAPPAPAPTAPAPTAPAPSGP